MGENINEKVSKGPTNVELVHKRAYKPGTFFWLPNHFHLTQCASHPKYIVNYNYSDAEKIGIEIPQSNFFLSDYPLLSLIET